MNFLKILSSLKKDGIKYNILCIIINLFILKIN